MNKKVSKRFGERLKELRERAGLSQADLAKGLKTISKAAIAKWEEGETSPSLDNVTAVADFFDLTLPELLGTSSDREADIRQAETLLKKWAPTFAAIKSAVHTVARREDSK